MSLTTPIQRLMSNMGFGIILPMADASGNPANVGATTTTVTGTALSYSQTPVVAAESHSIGFVPGSSSKIVITHNAVTDSTALSIFFVLKCSDFTDNYCEFFSKNTAGGGGWTGGAFGARSYVGSRQMIWQASGVQVLGNTVFQDNIRYDILVTMGPAGQFIYVNGVLDTSSTASALTPDSNPVTMFARNDGTYGFPLTGVNDIGLCAAQLEASDAAALHTAVSWLPATGYTIFPPPNPVTGVANQFAAGSLPAGSVFSGTSILTVTASQGIVGSTIQPLLGQTANITTFTPAGSGSINLSGTNNSGFSDPTTTFTLGSVAANSGLAANSLVSTVIK